MGMRSGGILHCDYFALALFWLVMRKVIVRVYQGFAMMLERLKGGGRNLEGRSNVRNLSL